MRKPLSPHKLAIADYGLLTTDLTVFTLLSASPAARLPFVAFGVVQGAVIAFTDQPLALRRPVPSPSTAGPRSAAPRLCSPCRWG